MREAEKLSFVIFVAGVTLGDKGPSGYAAAAYVVGSGLEYAEVSGGSDMAVAVDMEAEAAYRGLTRVPEGAAVEIGVSEKLRRLLAADAPQAKHPYSSLAEAARDRTVTWSETEGSREQAKVTAVALANAQRQS